MSVSRPDIFLNHYVAVSDDLPAFLVGTLAAVDLLAGEEREAGAGADVGVEIVGAALKMLDGVHIPDDIFITAALDVPQAVVDDSGEFLVRLGDDLPLGLDVEVAPAAGADQKGEGGGALKMFMNIPIFFISDSLEFDIDASGHASGGRIGRSRDFRVHTRRSP